MCRWHAGIFRCWGSWFALRWKAEVDYSNRGQNNFICREEKRKAAWGHAVGLRNWWSHGSGWKLGFYSLSLFFFIAWRWRCLSGANRCFLRRRSVFLASYHLLGPPATHLSLCLFFSPFIPSEFLPYFIVPPTFRTSLPLQFLVKKSIPSENTTADTSRRACTDPLDVSQSNQVENQDLLSHQSFYGEGLANSYFP
jgi:hypothetical protein